MKNCFTVRTIISIVLVQKQEGKAAKLLMTTFAFCSTYLLFIWLPQVFDTWMTIDQ